MSPPDYIPAGENAPVIDSGAAAAAFWREHVVTLPQFRPENEWTTTLLLDADRRLLGWLAAESDGARESVMFPKAKILRAALVSRAAGVVLMHNHPPGESVEPSEADKGSLHTLAVCLEMLEAGQKVCDFVVVDDTGKQFFSCEAAGELTARQAAIVQHRWKTWEEGLTLTLECLEADDPRIGAVVTELSAASGLSREQWFADWSSRAFVREFSPEPVEDRRLCLLGAVYSRSLKAAEALQDASRKAGVAASQFVWQEAVDVTVKKWEPAALVAAGE